jgi:hypothetical protein
MNLKSYARLVLSTMIVLAIRFIPGLAGSIELWMLGFFLEKRRDSCVKLLNTQGSGNSQPANHRTQGNTPDHPTGPERKAERQVMWYGLN